MDRDHLTRLIDDPARVQRDDIADLQAMTERYPWFSGAHLLLAVGGHREGDVMFDEQLRASAAHLPSRAVLFDRLHPSGSTPAPAMVPLTVVRDAPAAPRTDEENLEIAAIAAPAVEEPPMPAPAMPIEEEVPPPTAPMPTMADDTLDKLFRDAAVSASYELLLEHTPAPVSEVRAEKPVPAAVPVPAPTHRRFTDWLAQTDEIPVTGAAGTKNQPHNMAEPTPAQPVSGPAAPGTRASLEEPTDTKALIDRFIQQSVQQLPVKRAEFFNPQQAAKRSLEEHADLVTETLARIYEKQGNTAKAIAAYERLALKHPEKSAYFRSLAKALV